MQQKQSNPKSYTEYTLKELLDLYGQKILALHIAEARLNHFNNGSPIRSSNSGREAIVVEREKLLQELKTLVKYIVSNYFKSGVND